VRYFSSADAAAESLQLALLFRHEVDGRAFERHERLSSLAAEPVVSAQLFHRLARTIGDEWRDRTFWVTAPWGSLAHLPWAVGLAERLASQGLHVYLSAGQDPGLSFAASGPAERMPEPVTAKMAALSQGAVAAHMTDLSGVRWIAPASASTDRPAPSGPSCLILVETLPESLEGPYRGASGVDGVLVVASFRDHGIYELQQSVEGLRAAGHQLLGLIALGPAGKSAPESPLPESPLPESTLPESTLQSLPPTRQGDRVFGAFGARAAASEPQPQPQPQSQPPAPPQPVVSSAPPEASRREGPATVTSAFERKQKERLSVPPPVAPPPSPPEKAPMREAPSTLRVAMDLPTPPPSVSSPPLQPPSAPQAVPLLARWDARTREDSRAQRTATLIALSVVLLGAAAFIGSRLWPTLGGNPSAPTRPVQSSSPTGDSILDPSTLPWGTAPEAGETQRGPRLPKWLEEREAEHVPALEDSAFDEFEELESPDAIATKQPDLEAAPTNSASGWSEPRRPEQAAVEAAAAAALREAMGTPPFAIHFSSFRLRSEADMEIDRLRRLGIEARAVVVDVPQRGAWYRVLVGEFATFARAESSAVVLSRRHRAPLTHIVGQGGHGQPVPVGEQPAAVSPSPDDPDRR